MRRNTKPWMPLLLVAVFTGGMLFHSLVRGEVVHTYKHEVYNNPKTDQPYVTKKPSKKHPVKLIPNSTYKKKAMRVHET